MIDLEAVKARNDYERRSLGHRFCEDTFYACPMHEEYCGIEAPGFHCDCDYDDRAQRIADIDALIAEVEKLRRIVAASTLVEAAASAHEGRYGTSRGRLGRPLSAAMFRDSSCVDCSLGGLSSEEIAFVHGREGGDGQGGDDSSAKRDT